MSERPKARCEYCVQPNYIDELACRFCGGPLPMAAIPSIREGEVEKAFYGGLVSSVAAFPHGATQMSTFQRAARVLQSREVGYAAFLGGYLLTQALNA